MRFLIASLSLVLFATNAFAEDDAEKTAIAKELVDAVGGGAMFEQMIGVAMDQSEIMLREAYPQLSADEMNIIIDETRAAFREEIDFMVGESAKIYAKHLSVAEMRASIDFYNTDEGKALLIKMPVIMSEAMSLGQTVGANIEGRVMTRVNERLKKRGIEL